MTPLWGLLTAAMAVTATPLWSCSGDVAGAWERAPLDASIQFEAIQTFRIDTATGQLSICGSDRSWHSEFVGSEEELRFGFARRMRILHRQPDGSYASEVWEAEHEGTRFRYRVIATY